MSSTTTEQQPADHVTTSCLDCLRVLVVPVRHFEHRTAAACQDLGLTCRDGRQRVGR